MRQEAGRLEVQRWQVLVAAVVVAVPILLGGYLFFLFQENALREDIRHGVVTSADRANGKNRESSVKNAAGTDDDREAASKLRYTAVVIGILTVCIYLLLVGSLAFYYLSRRKNFYRMLFEKEKELREYHEAEKKFCESEKISRQSEARLNRGEAVAKSGNWELHMETGIMLASMGAKLIYGVEGDRWELSEIQKAVLPEYRHILDTALRRLIENGEPYNVEFKIRQAGTGEILDIYSIAEYDSEHRTLFGIVQDITKRKLLEAQLTQSQKLEGLGTLAGGIAHDFNNLLAVILGSAELMQQQAADQPTLKKQVDRIIEATERGRSISRQLLIFSRPGQAELQPISLTHTLNELSDLLSHFFPKSIKIATSIDVDYGMIMGDAGQIHQAILNLAINAGDAMTNDGTLTIREFTVAPEVVAERFGTGAAGPYVAVSVTDTGTGMDEATRAKIFDPFFTTKEKSKGTGLGLAIVQTIVNNHRGYIDVESAPGKGTTFTLMFPTVPM
jgi:signal transduction histidine kinase